MGIRFSCLTWLAVLFPEAARAGDVAPIVHTLRVSTPSAHAAEVSVAVPAEGRPTLELMMAVWTPGYYRVQNYAEKVTGLSARAIDGTALRVKQTQANRWRIDTAAKPTVVLSYRLECDQRSVTTNYVAEDYAVFNGAATFLTLVGSDRRPHEVRLKLPPQWARAMTALEAAPNGLPNHYRAEDFDTLVDSPIVAGDLSVHEFEVKGTKHTLVDVGDFGSWDGRRAAGKLEKIVRENLRFWGRLPFEEYYFLNVFRRGRGGLEHKSSSLLTSSPNGAGGERPTLRWLQFVNHEYFHAFNVKRLRPLEFGSFDYEAPPRTGSLWVSEGLTTYYGHLLVVRAGLAAREDFFSGRE